MTESLAPLGLTCSFLGAWPFLGTWWLLLLQGADLSHVSYEESKYLGGDIAHTHLVKGLDYALLQRVGGCCGCCCGRGGELRVP